MATEKNDHDLLIEIATKIDFFSEMLIKHIKEAAVDMKQAETKIAAAHRRLDQFMLSGILVVVLFVGSMALHFVK